MSFLINMARRTKSVELFLAVGLAASLAACGGGTVTSGPAPTSNVAAEGDGGALTQNLNWANTFDDGQVLADFVNKVVLPKYTQYVDTTATLSQAIDTFVKDPNQANLEAARQAWSLTRTSWEQTETFAFGPAGSLGFDGAMDSWPINQTDIEQILAGSAPLTEVDVAQLQDTERGMHTIEYLLFGEINNKTADQFTAREKQYLQALGQDLNTVASALLASWLSGVDGRPPYKDVLVTAGDPSNTIYPTTVAGAQEVVIGIVDSLTEVGEDKLEAPFIDQDPIGLESRFSFQTINDLKSNLKSAENGYLGNFPETGVQAGASISTYVASVDPALDQTVKTQFAAAQTALAAVPAPLETSLTDPDAADEIQAAIDSIILLKETIETQVASLI